MKTAQLDNKTAEIILLSLIVSLIALNMAAVSGVFG
jgi:hypothetical protein